MKLPQILALAFTYFLSCFTSSFSHADCAILLHGLTRSNGSMSALENTLKKEGYQVENVDYDSRHHTIEFLSKAAITPALKKCGASQPVHFVTHSLGGILLRQYLSQTTIPNLKHTVMLGPPNQGSEVIDKLKNVPGFSFLNGKAGLQLSTAKTSIPNSLGAVNFNVGIIAGNRSVNLILSRLIPGKDDGKVSVEHTKIEGMDDHLTLPVTHTFMMKNKTVIQQVLYYLKNGKFER